MKHIATFIILVIGMALPASASAYFTTNQEAFTLDGGSAGVFMIDFSFGHKKHEVRIPVHALNTTGNNASALSYAILNSANERVAGNAAAIVLSKTPIEDGMYVIPKGKKASFRLLTVFTTKQIGSFHAKVTHLPFTFDETQQLQLNPSELAYYVTGALTLGTPTVFTK